MCGLDTTNVLTPIWCAMGSLGQLGTKSYGAWIEPCCIQIIAVWCGNSGGCWQWEDKWEMGMSDIGVEVAAKSGYGYEALLMQLPSTKLE